MTPNAILGFAAISLAVVVVPGPSVMFAVSRALVAGRRDALLAVLGNASGVFAQVVLVALGLGVIVTGSDVAYGLLKTAGAAYLVWLGMSAIRHRHDAARVTAPDRSPVSSRPWRDGFVVGSTNPKSVVFLAALLPRYVEPAEGLPALQMLALGALFCGIAIVSDGAWAVLAARTRRWLAADTGRLAWTSIAGGLTMVTLGLLLLTG